MTAANHPTRRQALKLSGLMAVLAATSLASVTTAASPRGFTAPKPLIRPRSDWANGLEPVGPISREDVKFLIIHHSQSPNGYSPANVPGTLRGFYTFHTGKKGWPDVAYNFFVDEFGVIWEGRAGSLAGPVQGSATGGNQGFTQLCCFVGDFTARPPSQAAMESMAKLLAWLAGRYQIDLTGRTPIEFTSRGSNKWKRGKKVSTKPVVGHRDMSMTSCPGDALYALITGTLTKSAIVAAGQSAKTPGRPQPQNTQSKTLGDTGRPVTGSQPTPTSSRFGTPAGTAKATTTPTPSTSTSKTQSSPSPGQSSPLSGQSSSASGHPAAAGEPVAYSAKGWDSGAYAGVGIVGASVVGAVTWAAYHHKNSARAAPQNDTDAATDQTNDNLS